MDIYVYEKDWSAECVILFAFEGESPESLSPVLWEVAPWLAITPAMRDFKGKKKDYSILYGFPDLPISRVLIIGLGKRENVSLNDFRAAIAFAAKECRSKNFSTIGVTSDNLEKIAVGLKAGFGDVVKEGIIAAELSLYRYTTHKTKTEDEPKDPSSFTVFVADKAAHEAILPMVRTAEAEAEGVRVARDLVNGPANLVTPGFLADTAKKLAISYGFSCTTFNAEETKDMGMGAFWSVAQGSDSEGYFITLEHTPKGKEKDEPFIVVGKGITFDTGGISLKPAGKMHEMKGDMAGAAAVLGLFKAIGKMPEKESLPRIIGLIPTAENMPSGKATKPGDIVTTLSGKTVEIQNTDAEGRLILCDALTYAQKKWKPKALINIATLTGACVVALGDEAGGLFTDHRHLRRAVLDVAESLGELFWPLPMWDAYDKNIDSDVADMSNIGPREGGALHAALFLRRFVEKSTPWAHLDIAGSGYVVKSSSMHPMPGGTGEGVRLLCELARRLG